MARRSHPWPVMRSYLTFAVLAMSCISSEAPSDDEPEDVVEEAATTPPLSLARTFVTDGYVTSAATDGRILYLGGSFRYIGQRSGEMPLVSATTGLRDKSIAELGGGPVFAILPDGAGGYFVGGDFRSAGSIRTRGLAHLTAAGTWDPAWHISMTGAIYALAKDSSRLFVGGSFADINGQPHRNFAAFDLATGALVAGTPDASGGQVNALAVSGTRLFVGGQFGTIGGVARPRLARLDLPALTVSTWNPGAPDGTVECLLAVGSGLYVSGGFAQIGSAVRGRVASIDQVTAVVRPYNPNANNAVSTMYRLGSTLYLGGQFTTVGGQPRNLVAAVDASTGAILPPRATISGVTVRALYATADAVYVGGFFDAVGGQPRRYAAALAPSTFAVLPWTPRPNDSIFALAGHPNGVLLGGRLTSVNGSPRTNLAAIDLSTGRSTSWAPAMDTDPSARVEALHLHGTTLYVGGLFASLGGEPRVNLGALTTGGDLLRFRADTGGTVNAIVATDSFVYAGGELVQIGGIPRDHVAKLAATDGTVMAWSAPFGGTVLDLVLVGTNLYVGGFGTRLAAYDQETAAARPAPAVDGEVQALAYDGTRIYVAGFYQTIGGQPRNSLAAFTPGSTTVTSWNPPVPEFRRFSALGVTGSYVYAADTGKIYTLAKSTGAIQTFTTHITLGQIFDIAPLADRIIFVGGFHDIESVAQSNVAEFLGTP